MRPLRLELKGFTSFREETSIDFTELDVFAISGPTGSGKSSLMDAMTYALYGRVERVGDRVSQLISQGQPRMAVTLEFEVGQERYRVTRSTPASRGATKILVQRQNPEGEWEQAGEGADRVREADRILERALGLSYDGFTRSVLLPQGKFQEFLVGDATKRRAILIELLGLSLFRRMAERANATGKEAADKARWTTGMLDTEFADASPESLKAARGAAAETAHRERALRQATDAVAAILSRWQAHERSDGELRSSLAEATAAAADASVAAEELSTLAGGFHDAENALERSAVAAGSAQAAFALAQSAIESAEATMGSVQALADARLSAARLADAQAALETEDRAKVKAAAHAGALAEGLERADTELVARREAVASRELELRQAEDALDEARHADQVATLSAGLKPGDPCPVCGRSLVNEPKPAGAGMLADATGAVREAKGRLDAGRTALSEAQRGVDGARRDVEDNAREQDRLAARIEALHLGISEARGVLSGVLGDPLPDDPAADVQRRLDERRVLADAERGTADRLAEFREAVLRAEKRRDAIAAAIDRQRTGLAVDRGPLLERAMRALGSGEPSPGVPSLAPAADPAGLRDHAEHLAIALSALSERLSEELASRASVGARLLEEATEHVGGLIAPAPTLEGLAEALVTSSRVVAAELATSTKHAEDLSDKLGRKKLLAEEVKVLDQRSALFKALAQELRADRLIAYLQAEALHVLAAAGSDRLSNLSGGRYRLRFVDDEFLVVDTWNGDEERSVRTLSGGETFLASLSLALALADQVRSLSNTDRARIDSLFLDEGFGTLDAETLRVVIDAIELLAGDGRLVGVITHVQLLAEQFPRFEVQKSPRGSRVTLVTS